MRRFPLALLVAALALMPGAPWLAHAQTGKTLVVKPGAGPLAGQELYANSHALLIGVSKYQHLPADKRLKFADKDASALRDVLIRSYSFPAENITLLLNEQATKGGIEKALSSFADARRVGKEDRLLVFFSGHGQTVSLAGEGEMGFLIPYDAQVDLAAPDNAGPYLSSCVQMEGLWNYLRACPAKHALLLADACFSGLLVQAKALGNLPKLHPNELAKQAGRRARQVLTAGGKGEEAFEDASLGHGAFTYKLLEELRAEAQVEGEVFTTTDLAAALKRGVSNLTDGKQSPQFGSYRTEGEFLFITTKAQPVPPIPVDTPGSEKVVVRPAETAAERKAGTESKNPRDEAELVWVPAGDFPMGSEDGNALNDEKPVHRVRISKGFWLYKHEVTVAQFRKFCSATGRMMPPAPQWGWSDRDPVVNVSWEAAEQYSRWAGGRLPTEAEWEYAARGPQGSKFPWGQAPPTPQRAVYDSPGVERPRPVDSLPEGKSWCGAFHLSGNVAEWCSDWSDGAYYRGRPVPDIDPSGPAKGNARVVRGNAWTSKDFSLHSSSRWFWAPDQWAFTIGFRIVRSD